MKRRKADQFTLARLALHRFAKKTGRFPPRQGKRWASVGDLDEKPKKRLAQLRAKAMPTCHAATLERRLERLQPTKQKAKERHVEDLGNAHASETATTPPWADPSAPEGFDRCLEMPKNSHAMVRNLRIWRDPADQSRWLMEPAPMEVDEAEWTPWTFSTKESRVKVFCRGRVDFLTFEDSRGRHERIYRGDTLDAEDQGSLESDLCPAYVDDGVRLRWLSDGSRIFSTGLP